MSPQWWKASLPRKEESLSQQMQEPQVISRFWQFWAVLGVALMVRLLWVDLFQNFIGADAIRYLWISQHVSRGEWQLLPQLYTSPLLPALMGLLARVTQDHLLAGRVIAILSNTLAVGLGMILIRRLFPQRPALAWLTGLGLALNHVWCRMAPFVLTDNLFYLLLLGLLVLMTLLMERVTWIRAMAFGLVWGLLFLCREIGLYCGASVFFVLLAAIFWKQKQHQQVRGEAWRLSAASLPVLALILIFWGAWFYHTFGIVSLGEGRRFGISYTQKFDRKGRHPYYEKGTMSLFNLRPHEQMEFTRFPKPDDERFPPSGTFSLLHRPLLTFQIMWDNFVWTYREFQRTTLVGCIVLFFLLPVGILTRRLSLPESVYWAFGASLGMLGLHFFGPVREARLIGWFFPWLYLTLGGFTLWLWQRIQASTWGSAGKKSASLFIGGLFLFHLLYPQYFKEVPKRWSMRLNPQVHILASEQIRKTFGPGAVIASREPEVVFRSGGYWIGLPYGTTEQLVEWLYLGGANYLLLHDLLSVPEEEKIFWADPEELHKQIPELEVVADFTLKEPPAFGKHGRLWRFQPRPEKLAGLREQYPWAGTHPRVTGAWAPDLVKPIGDKQ
jgi:hypothetical protein